MKKSLFFLTVSIALFLFSCSSGTKDSNDNSAVTDQDLDMYEKNIEPDDSDVTDDEYSNDSDNAIHDGIIEFPDEEPLEAGTKLFGTDKDEYGLSLAMDNDGNIFLTGFTEGNLDGIVNSGASDIFLMKFDKSGKKLWTRLYGTEKTDFGRFVKTDSSGNIFISGYTLEEDENEGTYDGFLMKLDKNGEPVWVKQATEENSVCTSIVFDETENIYISGYIDDSNDLPSAGTQDAFLAKFSQDGTRIWLKKWGSENYDAGAITFFHDGYIYVPGFTNGDVGGTGFLGGTYDAFLTKLDTDGNISWTKQWGTIGTETAYSLQFDNDSNMFLCGSASGEMEDPDLNDSGVSLTKLDSDGNFEWTNIWKSESWESANYIISDTSGNFYLSGFTLGNLDDYENAGEGDAFLMKVDSSGNKIWTKLFGGKGIEMSYGSIMDIYGNIYVTGLTMSDLDGNKNAGETDIFLTKFKAEDL